MNALEIVQQAADTLGFERPKSIANMQDLVARRLVSALNRALEEIIRDYDWQALVFPYTFVTTTEVGEGGYHSTSMRLAGYDMGELLPQFDYFVTDYLYDFTDNIKIDSVTLDKGNMEYMFRRQSTGHPSFVFASNMICFIPDIPKDHKITFYYKSKFGVYDNTSADGNTFNFKEYFENNTDMSFLNSQLLLRGLLWKYKFETGGDYSESYRDYEKFLNKLKDQDSIRRRVSGHGNVLGTLDIPFNANGSIAGYE